MMSQNISWVTTLGPEGPRGEAGEDHEREQHEDDQKIGELLQHIVTLRRRTAREAQRRCSRTSLPIWLSSTRLGRRSLPK
jgi:hypothetical protein